MPNHFHGIVEIQQINKGTACCAPTDVQFRRVPANSLCVIVRGFKSAVTKQVNMIRNTPGKSVWQRNYFEHVIRNEKSLDQIREYIVNNPARWEYEKNDYRKMF